MYARLREEPERVVEVVLSKNDEQYQLMAAALGYEVTFAPHADGWFAAAFTRKAES